MNPFLVPALAASACVALAAAGLVSLHNEQAPLRQMIVALAALVVSSAAAAAFLVLAFVRIV